MYVHKPASYPSNRSPKNAGAIRIMFRGWFGKGWVGRLTHSTVADFYFQKSALTKKRDEIYPYKSSS
jgi:hypothetical protein